MATKADEIQINFYKNLTGEGRLKIAAQLRQLSLKIMEAGIRDNHPDLSNEQIHKLIIARLLPPSLFKKAYPGIRSDEFVPSVNDPLTLPSPSRGEGLGEGEIRREFSAASTSWSGQLSC